MSVVVLVGDECGGAEMSVVMVDGAGCVIGDGDRVV